MRSDVVARVLPSLAARVEPEFNLFEVLHHGTHEKQISNLFAWLLNSEGTHKLGDAFARIFVDEVNRGLEGHRQIAYEPLSVGQEVDTSGSGADIADLVLEGASTAMVVENYYTSDGHGHSYEGYLRLGEQGRKTCVVVLLCERVNPESQRDGWEFAPVVTYRTLVHRLLSHIGADPKYQQECPEQYSFFRHMQRQFLKGTQVKTEQLVDFIDAMCQVGESDRLSLGGDDAALKFADIFRELAITNFNESRDLLFEVKRILKEYGSRVLRDQVNEALAEKGFGNVHATYRGSYQWTVNFEPHEPAESSGGEIHPDGGDPGRLQLKFGPSARFANVSSRGKNPRTRHYDLGHEAALRDVLADLGGKLGLYTPPDVSARIMAQRGRFVFGVYRDLGYSTLPVERNDWTAEKLSKVFSDNRGIGQPPKPAIVGIEIKAGLKQQLREILDQSFGMTGVTLFPDLHGFAAAHGVW